LIIGYINVKKPKLPRSAWLAMVALSVSSIAIAVVW